MTATRCLLIEQSEAEWFHWLALIESVDEFPDLRRQWKLGRHALGVIEPEVMARISTYRNPYWPA